MLLLVSRSSEVFIVSLNVYSLVQSQTLYSIIIDNSKDILLRVMPRLAVISTKSHKVGTAELMVTIGVINFFLPRNLTIVYCRDCVCSGYYRHDK